LILVYLIIKILIFFKLPFFIVLPILSTTMIYWSTNLNNSAACFFNAMIVLILVANVSVSFGEWNLLELKLILESFSFVLDDRFVSFCCFTGCYRCYWASDTSHCSIFNFFRISIEREVAYFEFLF
jgi:hypothetical protein